MTTAEQLGPAERIIAALIGHTDHLIHNRAGVVVPDARARIGVRWDPATHVLDNGVKVVYRTSKAGKTVTKTRVGTLREIDNQILEGARVVGEYRPAGIFPEVAVWMYREVANVWKLDNEFAARWASYAFAQEHRDLKVVLAAFCLVQSRKGDPVFDSGKIAFFDEDYRDVGEAMALIVRKDNKDLSPKLLLRIRDVLRVPGVAAINRDLGFGTSARTPFLGRWPKVVEKWLQCREENPKLLEGLVKAGFRGTVMDLCSAARFKPKSLAFFQALRWKQTQSEEGHRTILGEVTSDETWEGLTERQICERIVSEKPDWKRIVGFLPKSGATRAIVAAAVEAGCMSNRDLIILTPTLEELGLLQDTAVKAKWDRAVKKSEDDVRAANIAKNVKSTEVKEQLQTAADNALKKVVEEATRNLRIYIMIDTSGSMGISIDRAKILLGQFLPGFPLDRVHVSVFNTTGRIVKIPVASTVGVEQAFRGINASGGTSHASGVLAHIKTPPKDDEDVLFLFIGDSEEQGSFEHYVQQSGLRPTAFGFLRLGSRPGAVERTALALNIPCFMIEEQTFADVYAIPRTLRTLIASTPVRAASVSAVVRPTRTTLVSQILATELLKKPAWAVTAKSVPKAA